MKIKIHNGESYGTLCYYMSDVYSKVYRNALLFDSLIQRHNLEYLAYEDFCEDKCYIKIHGSIINMLRFRNTLKHLYNLRELI